MTNQRALFPEFSRLSWIGTSIILMSFLSVASFAQGLDLENLRGTLGAGDYELSGTVTVTGDLEITPDATVRVEAGTTLRFDGRFRSFVVQGRLELNGTGSNPIVCTSVENSGPDQWGGLDFSPGSSGSISHTEFRFGGGETAGMIDIDQATVSIVECRFQESGEDGIRVRNIAEAGDVLISNCLFVDNDDDHIECSDASPTISGCEFRGDAAAVWLSGTSYPVFSADLKGDESVGVWLDGATLVRSGTLTDPGMPYILDGDLTVPPDVSLTIAPNTFFKGTSFHRDLNIQGNLEIAGTEQKPVVFSSFADDERGGDSNNDGDADQPEGDDWGGIRFSPESTGKITYAEFYYGGGVTSGMLEIHQAAVSVEHCVFMYSGQDGITITDIEQSSDVVISGSHFDGNKSDDIDCQNASPTIHGCEFHGEGNAVWLSGTSFPDFNNDLVAPGDGVTVGGTTLARSGVWELAGVPYIIDGDVTIPPDVELTLPAGAILKINSFHHNFEIQGKLSSIGTEQQPITLTSDHDDSVGGDTNGDGDESRPEGDDWAGLSFAPGSVGELVHTHLFYGGGATEGMIDISQASVRVTRCLFSHSGEDGIEVNNILNPEDVLIEECEFVGNESDDIECNDASPSIRECRFDGAADSIFLMGTSFPRFSGDLESDGNGIWVDGTTFSRSGAWEFAGIPYILHGDVVIPQGVTLSVEPGVAIKGHNFHHTIDVYGDLSLVGTEEDPILLTSYLDHDRGVVKRYDYSPRFVDSVKVTSGSVVLLEEDFLDDEWVDRWVLGAMNDAGNTIGQEAGRLRANDSSNYIESVEAFEGPLRVELVVEAAGSEGQSCWDFAIEVLGLSEQSGLLRFDRDDLDSAGIGSSPIDSETCLSDENASIDEAGVNSGVFVWEYDGRDVRVSFVNSDGEEIPLSRQAAEGEPSGKLRLWLNGEGAPSGGNWGGIYFGSTGGGTIENVELRYGGGVLDGNVQIENSSRVVLRNSVSRFSDDDGVRLLLHELGTPVLVENLWLEGNERDGIRVSGGTAEIRHCSILGNGENRSGDGVSCNEGAHVSVIECDIRANRQDGIDASEAQVTVRGNTIAENGSEGNSEGYGIGLYNGATGTIENNIIRDNFPRDGIFLDESREARVVNNTIMGNHRDGIYADDASAYIEENDISSNGEDGIDSENSVLEIQACLIRDNGFGEDESAGIYAHGSENSLRVNDSVIVSNSDWAILNKSKTIIDATDNWWGDPTGPFHERDNVFGRGDAVSDLVSFVPFKTRVSGEAPVVAGELLDGVAARGTFSRENRLRYYRLEVPQGKNLLVRFRDADGLGLNHVYLRHGDFPSPGVFDYRHETSAADQQVFVPAATAGTWYILVYQFNSGGSDEYTIEVELRDVVLFGVSPTKQGNEAEMTLSVAGGGFVAGAQLELIAGQRMFSAASTEVDSYTQLTASFERASVPPGVYDVQVTVPEIGAARLEAAFEVLSEGEPKLVTNLVVPSQVGYHQVATIYVEYANEGEVAMTAPLLVVTAEQSGQRKGLLTLDKSIVNRGFWTSATPSGFSHSVEILGSGEKAGILNAGESKRIPVYYVGWLRPWDPEYPPIGFRLGVISDSNSTPINWGALETRMRPTGIDPAAWSAIYGNFTSQAGSTWGEFVSLLSGNAKYLSRLGEEIRDMDVLLDFEFSQANGMSILPELSTVYDLDNRASRLPLFFKRSFPQGIQARHRLGPLGRGWTHNWEAHLEEESDGKVRIEMTGRFWTFEPDSRGGFLADLENVSLEKRGSTFLLRFADESSYEFEESRLVRVTDAYDNAIDLEYSVERLARLVHSHGYVVDLGYDAAGRIQHVSDNTDQRAEYTYSGNGDLLRQVEYSNGKRSEYSYLGNEDASRQYALGEIQFPDGSHQYFEYDSRGRLAEFSRDEEVNRVRLQYDSDGRIVLNEGEADTRSFFVDHRGRMRRLVNAEESVVNVEYNAMDRIAKITGPDGLTYRHEYDEDGRLVETIDPDGNRSAFFWRDPAVLELYTDKKGVPTRYLRQNDDNGSTLTERRPDGTSVSNAYDSRGLRTQRINARGGVTLFEHDERGRLVRTTAPDESVTEYQYDAGNNIVRAENGQGVISLDYDDYNRLIQMDHPGRKVLQFTYNENGQRASMIDPEGNQVRYSYDEIGRLRQLEAGGGELYVRYDYDLRSRIVGRELGNGMTTEYQYDSMGRVTSLINRDPDGASVSEFHYRYDPYGRRTEMRTLNGTWTYEYDHLGRLMGADFESVSGSLPNENYRYEYDAMGNRVRTIVNGLETSYEVNTMNQPVQVGGSEWGYDEDGNLRQGSEGGIVWNYSYDSLNRLVRVASGETTLDLAYDALGHLSEVTQDGVTRSYLYDPVGLQNIVAEYDSAGEVATAYVHGHGLVAQLDRNGPSAFFSSDALGSTSELSSPSGAILSQYGYGPFGNVRFETEPGLTSFKFLGSLGQRQLASNLIDMRARVYHSGLGQFLSEDPLKFSLDSNRIYADSDPLNRIDPSGLQPKNIISGVVGVGGGLAGIAAGGTLGPALGFGAIVYGGYKAATGVINYYFPNDDGTYPFSTSIYQDVIGIDKWIDEMWVDARLQEKPTDYTTADGIALALDQAMGLLPSADTDKIFDIINDVLNADATGEVLGKKLAEILELLNEDEVDWDLVETLLAQSIDPNEKVGPAGYGPMRFIRNDRLLAYRIDFENDEDASAPAQVVQITDALDPDLDWSTFELTEVGFGDFLIPVPPKTQHFEQTQMMSFNGKYFAVEIDIRLDPNTGELRALFSSMDPLVGFPPAVDVGFLPPEDGTGRGMGYLSYLIKPKSDRPTGTDLRNIATIVFDFGEVINTNQVDPHDPTAGTDPEKEAFNTIDADMPVSEVAVLPATVDVDRFEVRWSGVDGNGSGVRSYDVYVQEDGGSFSLWLDNVEFNSALFEGQSGHRYGFYSVATDHVGLVETGKRSAEAQTTVTGTVSDESPYDLWGQQHFTVQERTDPLVSGETADPDHDGILNLVEFALLLDPRNPDPEGLPQAGFVVDQDDLFVTLTFRKRQGVSGLGYRIDSSDDLGNWRAQVVQEVLLTSDSEKDVVMVLLPVTSDERKFIRLSIELSE